MPVAALYTPAGEHRTIRLTTPLDCVILDTQALSLCRLPATLACSIWKRLDAIQMEALLDEGRVYGGVHKLDDAVA